MFLWLPVKQTNVSPCVLVRQLVQEGRVFPVDVSTGVIQLQQFGQRGHAGIVIHEHRRKAGGFPLDATGTTHRGQKLQISDAALFVRCACADLLVDCFLDTRHVTKQMKNKKNEWAKV